MTRKKPRRAPAEVQKTPPVEPASDEDDGWGTVYRWAREEPLVPGHAYGIVLDVPNWQSVVEFMPPS